MPGALVSPQIMVWRGPMGNRPVPSAALLRGLPTVR
jgi:hypothetical protein